METISKHIGEGFGKGELYAALAYDTSDAFGGMQIKQLKFSPASGSTAIQVGTRTESTAVSISTGGSLTGLNIGVIYDAEGVANTTDYIGTAAIFNYIHGIECKTGNKVTSGMATIWANYEIDYQIYGSGGLSAGWFSIWADAAGDAAHIRSSAGARALHIQGIDIALVSSAAFDLGSNCDLFGLRIDSSIDNSATMSGHFYGINIAKSSGSKKDWQIGVDINNSIIGISIDSATTGIALNGTYSGDTISISNAALTAGDTYSGIRCNVTAAAANNAYGAAGYFQTGATGTFAGHVYGFGSWINFSSSANAQSFIVAAQDNGLYGTITCSSAKLIFGMRMEAIVTGSPQVLAPFSINVGGSDGSITALFAVDALAAISWVSGSPTAGTPTGSIPIICDNNGSSIKYVHTYDSRS